MELHEALLLHQPESITVNMASWRGHFGTLMPFYVACEKAGGFVGKQQEILAAPQHVPGGFVDLEDSVEKALSGAGVVELEQLGLYRPPKRRDGSIVDWGAPIRCACSPKTMHAHPKPC